MLHNIKLLFLCFIAIQGSLSATSILNEENIETRMQAMALMNSEERASHTFNFKRFLKHSADNHGDTQPVIHSLRRHLCNPHLPKMLIADLGEGVGFMLDRLLRLEIKHLKIDNTQISILTNQFNSFIGSIYEEISSSSVTATLLPVPSTEGDEVIWYALTCAHVLDMIELSIDHGSAKLHFLKPGLPLFPVESITIFKKKHMKIVNIGSDENLQPNTIYLNDIRALPRYDGIGGDVALCKLNIDKSVSDYLMAVELNIRTPIWINNQMLHIEKYTDFYKRNKIGINFHFIDHPSKIIEFVQVINSKPKASNFVFGLAPNKDIVLSRARNPSTEIYPSHLFVDPNPPETLDNLCFFHDAPTCKGMSGGAIFQITDNQIDVFGVVKGCRSPKDRKPENVARCVGSFLQKQLFIDHRKKVEKKLGRAPDSSPPKEQCSIM
jgi:hypothetical protein